MRRKPLLINSLFAWSFLCGQSMAMETQYSDTGRYPFTKANLDALRAFTSSLEEREYEETKHRDEEGNFLIDYERMRVCDIGTSLASHYSQVFDEIRPLFQMVGPSQAIVMNFAGNFLQDEGISAVVDFVLENPLLKNRLRRLDLSNNRFRAGCLPKLKDLVEQCPYLEKLNIAINYISTNEVNQAFQGLSIDKRSIVDFAPY